MTKDPFIRYIINQPNFYWWKQYAEPFLHTQNWIIHNPKTFDYQASYGFDPNFCRTLPGANIPDEDYCIEKASVVVEYHGTPSFDSIFDPASGKTIIEDLLAFLSLYSGTYCQYFWRELRMTPGDNWSATLNLMINTGGTTSVWAAPEDNAITFFQQALRVIPTINQTQFRLASQWFFSALKEYEIGRALVETALNWVCLESQANVLGKHGTKKEMVAELLTSQGFPNIPLLPNFYKLRNDAFHEGQLSHLGEPAAQAAREAGRVLVRASILNLLGMDQREFNANFVRLYA